MLLVLRTGAIPRLGASAREGHEPPTRERSDERRPDRVQHEIAARGNEEPRVIALAVAIEVLAGMWSRAGTV